MSSKLPPGARIIQAEAPPQRAELADVSPMTYQPMLDYRESFAEASQANVALLLAILGWFFCGVLGVISILMSRTEISRIQSGHRPPQNLGTAKVAFWLSVVQIAMYGMLIAVMTLGVAAAIFG